VVMTDLRAICRPPSKIPNLLCYEELIADSRHSSGLLFDERTASPPATPRARRATRRAWFLRTSL
jgi:hypothetical protein